MSNTQSSITGASLQQPGFQQFKLRILYSVMLIAAGFAGLFGLLSDLGINNLGRIHTNVNYVYSLVSFILIALLYLRKINYTAIASLFLIASLLTFVSALSFVLNDEFRIIWFYFLIYVTYITLGSRAGGMMSALVLLSIIVCNYFMDLQISDTAMITAVLGLLIASLLNRVYTRQMELYETKINDTIKQLDTALEDSRAASNSKSLFLANMSHEIRTPMNGVMGMIQALYGTDVNEEQAYYLDTLNSSSKNLLSLIDDLLDLSKVESGKLSLNIQAFNAFDWITDIHNVIEPLFENRDIRFTTEVDPSLPEAFNGDATRLFQVAVNLLSNASKYTLQGDVSFKVRGHYINDPQYLLHMEVKDTGIGIEDKDLTSIFDAFQQLSADRTSNKGVGLGLAICKRLADRMGGKIWVESVVNQGTSFYFEVPLTVARVHETVVVDQVIQSGPLNVLLVDDDAINRLAAATLLKQKGHHVEEAADGQQALEKLEDNTFDIMLLDIHMPVMDGIETTNTIRRSNAPYKNIPVIGFTASVMSDEIERYIQEGMNDVVEKPIDIKRLLRVMYRLMNEKGSS